MTRTLIAHAYLIEIAGSPKTNMPLGEAALVGHVPRQRARLEIGARLRHMLKSLAHSPPFVTR